MLLPYAGILQTTGKVNMNLPDCPYDLDPSTCPSTCNNCKIEELVLTDPPKQLARQLDLDIQASKELNFTCPHTKTVITSCCKVKECEYWTKMSWSNNCILAYAMQQEIEAFKPEDIAILLCISLEKVNEIITGVLAKLREETITIQEIEPQFSYVPTSQICCVCFKPIETFLPSLTIPTLQLAYCSKECKQHKPPQAIQLEAKYGISIEDILKWASHKFATLPAMEQALGMDRWAIKELIQQFHPILNRRVGRLTFT